MRMCQTQGAFTASSAPSVQLMLPAREGCGGRRAGSQERVTWATNSTTCGNQAAAVMRCHAVCCSAAAFELPPPAAVISSKEAAAPKVGSPRSSSTLTGLPCLHFAADPVAQLQVMPMHMNRQRRASTLNCAHAPRPCCRASNAVIEQGKKSGLELHPLLASSLAGCCGCHAAAAASLDIHRVSLADVTPTAARVSAVPDRNAPVVSACEPVCTRALFVVHRAHRQACETP